MIGLLQSGTGRGSDSSRPSEESGSADSRCAAVTPLTLPAPFGPPPAAAAAPAPPGAPPGPAPFEPSAPGRPPFAAEAPLEAFLPRAGALPPACARPAPAPALLASAPDCPGEPLPDDPPEDTPTGRIGTPPVGSRIFSAGGRGGVGVGRPAEGGEQGEDPRRCQRGGCASGPDAAESNAHIRRSRHVLAATDAVPRAETHCLQRLIDRLEQIVDPGQRAWPDS